MIEYKSGLIIQTDLGFVMGGRVMQIAVCDDEKVFMDQMMKYLDKHIPLLEETYGQIAVETFSSGEALLCAYQENKRYDILFLDLRMDKINGFEAARQIRLMDNRVIIIFITSLMEYVFKSFEYKPFWYMTKPITESGYISVLKKALAEHHSVITNEYAFKTREDGLERVNITNIIYLESLSRQIKLHTIDGDYFFYGSINKEEAKLTPFGFVRIHKSFLVNTLFIQRVGRTSLYLKNGEALPISERRYKTVFDVYTDFLARSSI
jgi:two-component system response regulator LytT